VRKPQSLFVQKDRHGDDPLTAGISLRFRRRARLLTDGSRILGTGYSLDAKKYARYAKR
jgi:hypothetical protein